MAAAFNGDAWSPDFEDLVRRHTALLGADEPLEPGTVLYELGMDSLRSLQLMFRIEQDYQISFPDELLTPETFATPGRLWRIVCDLRAGPG